MLSENGAPTPVAATRLRAPESLMGPVDAAELDAAVGASDLRGRYAQAVDRESAFEKLRHAPPAAGQQHAGQGEEPSLVEQVVKSGMFMFTSLARSVGTQLGREITRSLFGTARRRR